MSVTSKITESNQVTIPADILKKAEITIGTILRVELRDDGILLKPENISAKDSFRQAWREIQAGKTLLHMGVNI